MDKKRVLVVDDEVDITATFRIIFEDAGFGVDTFNDPFLALSSFKPHFYDLVILDILMPGLDGFVLCSEIKKKDNKIKILFLTANDIYYLQQKEMCTDLTKDS